MKKLYLNIILLLLLPLLSFSQNSSDVTIAKTNSGEVKIPGTWEELNSTNDTGQIFFRNSSGIVIAVAQNPKKAYPFFKPG